MSPSSALDPGLRAAAAGLLFCLLGPAARAQAPADPTVPVPKFWTSPDADTVRFIAVGDFGTGHAHQYQVAEAIRSVCAARRCDFVLGLGDLIYETGVASSADAQFDTKFEAPFANLTLPFYQALGNHDNSDPADGGQGGVNAAGNHEVAYHYRAVGGVGGRASDKWRMPSRYYTFQHGYVAQFYALDTNPLMGLDAAWNAARASYGADQTGWLQAERAASAARWHIAFGHHPYRSNGPHGNAGQFDGQAGRGFAVGTLIEDGVCAGADFYLAGHDHNLQWLAPAPSCSGAELIVSGSGSKLHPIADPARNPAYYQRSGWLGFVWMELTPSHARGVVYTDRLDVLFERTVAAAPLPVELAAFTATSDGDGVRLAWATASETRNAGFAVEVAEGAGTAAGAWRDVAFIAGHGTTSEAHAYAHRVTGLAPGRHRFRLRQTDLDGAATFSPEATADVGLAAPLVLLPPAPNPARGTVTVRFALRASDPARLAAYDALGREVALLFDGDAPGGVVLSARLDAARLAPGVYALRLASPAGAATQRLVVAR